MQLRLFLTLLPSVLAVLVNGARDEYPFGDIRNCPVVQPTPENASRLLRMEVLPGNGFDNLRNMDMSQVIVYNYSLCKVTSDGQYLIPDDVLVIPTRKSNVEVYAQLIDHWNEYKSMTSFSINTEASVYSLVDGKFSTEYQYVKIHQVQNKAQTTRIQIRHNLYKVSLQPDSQLHPKFKNRLLDIAANLQSNNTAYAGYLAEMLVREYGTHVIKGADAGAILAQLDTVSSHTTTSGDGASYSASASASANFFNKFSFSAGFDFSFGSVDSKKYLQSRHSSHLMSFGGPPIQPNMTVQQWQKEVPNALVAIDRQGDPLYYVISSQTLPELPMPTLRQLVKTVYKGIVRYYEINTHYGCTDPNSPNFNYQANIEDNSCQISQTNFTFGGTYQTCQVDSNRNTQNLCELGAQQPNPLTGSMSCPDGYQSTLLHSGTVTQVSQKKVCRDKCHRCGFLWLKRCCKCMSVTLNVLSAAYYQAYWCVATGTAQSDSGYMFGGLYTSKAINPTTKSMSCPNRFFPLHMGSDIEVCVSDEYQLTAGYAIPFGGFFSCQAGNPLATAGSSGSNTKRCPQGYIRTLATIEEGCEIIYCAKFKPDISSKPPQLPPFRSKPGLKKNVSQALVIEGPYGRIWVRDDQGNWVRGDTSMTGDELLALLEGDGGTGTAAGAPSGNTGGLSPGVSAAISGVATFLICTLIAVIALVTTYATCKRKKKKNTRLGTYLEISGDNPRQPSEGGTAVDKA